MNSIHKSKFTGRQADVNGQIYLEYQSFQTGKCAWVSDEGGHELMQLPPSAVIINRGEL